MADMLTLLPEYDHDQFDSRYRIVLVAAQRAKQLMKGAKPTIASKFTKAASVAVEETLKGHVKFLTGEEAKQAIREFKRKAEREFDRAILGEAYSEDAQEIQKQLSVYVDDSPKVEAPVSED